MIQNSESINGYTWKPSYSVSVPIVDFQLVFCVLFHEYFMHSGGNRYSVSPLTPRVTCNIILYFWCYLSFFFFFQLFPFLHSISNSLFCTTVLYEMHIHSFLWLWNSPSFGRTIVCSPCPILMCIWVICKHFLIQLYNEITFWISLVVQRMRLPANARDMDLIPGLGGFQMPWSS